MVDINGIVVKGNHVVLYLGTVYKPCNGEDTLFVKTYESDYGQELVVVGEKIEARSPSFVDSREVMVLSKESNPEWYV